MRPPTAKLTIRDVLLGPECARHAQRQRFVAGLDDAGGLDDVLRLQGGDQRRAIDAEAGELLHREFDENPLVLRAQDLDLRDVADLQQLRADVLDIVAQLAMREAVGGEAVDDAEGIAELVVEARSDDAGRQGVADVADALADVIPDVRHFPGGGAALQIDEDRRDAGAREAAQVVELRRFLQLALEPLGHLLERVLDGRARPGGLHHHRLDDEGGILVAAEPQ